MICHLLSSEPNFCFDKLREKNQCMCKWEYLPHSKHHCSSIAGKDLQSWLLQCPLQGSAWLGGPQSLTVCSQQRTSTYRCSAKTVMPEVALNDNSYDWHVPCAQCAASSAVLGRAPGCQCTCRSRVLKIQPWLHSSAYMTTPGQACSQSYIIWLARCHGQGSSASTASARATAGF